MKIQKQLVAVFAFIVLTLGLNMVLFASPVLAVDPPGTNPTLNTQGTGGVNDDKPSSNGGFVPCGNSVDDPCTISHLFRALVGIINYLIGMAGFVAVLFIVVAGVQMVYSQGQTSLTQAKQRLSGAIIGLVLVAISFLLVNTLFEGSLALGIKNGGKVFTDPRGYINEAP